MRADSLVIGGLLCGTAVLAVGSLVTLATTTLVTPAAVGSLALLVLAVLAASALGVRIGEKSRTPYW